MLYIFSGSDTTKVADNAHTFVRAAQKKYPNAQVFRVHGEDVTTSVLDEYAHAQGLFEQKYVVLITRPFEYPHTKKACMDRLSTLSESKNLFVVIENTLDASTKKILQAHAYRIEMFEKKESKTPFNTFALGDALGEGNKKRLWLLYHQALHEGVAPETICGTLLWALRGILAASVSKSPEEAGQKPFVYKKFLRFAQKSNEATLRKKYSTLISIYHNAHRGVGGDLATAIESWILKQ